MLIEKTPSRITETAIPIEAIGPLLPKVRLRVADAGFRPVGLSDLESLTEFYAHLDEPLADINALVMVAWRRVLDLHLLIEDEVLYLIANWEGGPMLWGPPIGERVSMDHVRRGFELLHAVDPDNSEPVIAYLWERYSLWRALVESNDFALVREGTEYIYDTNRIASLAGRAYKKKRKDYTRFQQAYNPSLVDYSYDVVRGCLNLLDKWKEQKSQFVSGADLEKLLAEDRSCRNALDERLPLTGVVALIGDNVCAFSLGFAQGRNRFNCLFEKTDLELPQAPAFIFCELARKYKGSYSEITLGEDWHIDYLATSKRLWQPVREQASYYLQENLVQFLA